MATRFTDDINHNVDGNDFIVRKRRPVVLQIFLIFLIVFWIILFAEIMTFDSTSKIIFFCTLVLTIGSLGWFTIFLTLRNRDLVLATEFQNAMLASAAQLSTRFCLITKRDGTIVYIDPGFQKLFPQFLQSDARSIDRLLMASGIPDEMQREVLQSLAGDGTQRYTLPFSHADGSPMPMVVTVEILPRPKGYFLFRGRDYVEKRMAAKVETYKAEKSALPLAVMAQVLHSLPEAILITDEKRQIIYASNTVADWLGFAEGELESQEAMLEHVCYQYEGFQVGKVVSSDFQGSITFQRKNRTLVRLTAVQKLLTGDDSGLCILLTSDHDVKKNSPEQPAEQARGKLTDFIASSPIAVALLDATGTVLECNAPLRELTKFKSGESGWKFIELVREDGRSEVSSHIERLLNGQPPAKKPLDITLATEEVMTVSLYLSGLKSEEKHIIAQIIDTTEQKNLEQRFAHSQKMQAVGQLAGGVAHDFNNLLTAMIGFCDLLLIRHPAGDQSFADIMQVKQNANRAANLVRQLLAFSRRQTLQPKMLDVTDVLAELSNLIRRLIGENIELKVVHGRDLGVVKADQGQLEQVFINLAVNARDAMQNGGRLTIQTSHVRIDRAHPISRSLVPPLEDEAIVDGDYVLVEVMDNGTGIPRKLMQKIFEPFFSTKEVGSGTGLGLATVYGIIKQTGGYIYVSSKEGVGTTFSLFFKRYQHEEVKAVIETAATSSNDDLTGNGTVLLVEDETPVRTFAARALRNKGYTVLEADCGENAIEVMEAQGNEVDVIISDVIMPGINGPTMIETIAPKFPRVKVIFISGYAEDIFVKNYGSEREFNFLPKPFTLKQLASKVKEVIQK